jgi:hypothetical protein
MNGSKSAALPADRIEVELALAAVVGMAMIACFPREVGVEIDQSVFREAEGKLLDNLKRQYDRKIRARALRLRHDWRKADIGPLVTLFLIPAVARKPTQHHIGLLIKARGKGGKAW